MNQYDKAITSLKRALEIVPGLKFTRKVLELAEKGKKTNLGANFWFIILMNPKFYLRTLLYYSKDYTRYR